MIVAGGQQDGEKPAFVALQHVIDEGPVGQENIAGLPEHRKGLVAVVSLRLSPINEGVKSPFDAYLNFPVCRQ